MIKLSKDLILASASPRRKDLLEQIGFTFTVVPSSVDESHSGDLEPNELVRMLAERKAQDVAASNTDSLVLGADTIVVMDDKIVGKPASADEAKAILRLHSGREHIVYTGFAIVHQSSGRLFSDVQTTRVKFGSMSEIEIDAYVRDGSPMDKAGAYGYQDRLGPLFVDSISGDYYNVIGLPLRAFYKMLITKYADFVAMD